MVFDYADYSKFTIEKIKQSKEYGIYSFETIDEIYDAIKDRYNEKYRFVKDGVKLLWVYMIHKGYEKFYDLVDIKDVNLEKYYDGTACDVAVLSFLFDIEFKRNEIMDRVKNDMLSTKEFSCTQAARLLNHVVKSNILNNKELFLILQEPIINFYNLLKRKNTFFETLPFLGVIKTIQKIMVEPICLSSNPEIIKNNNLLLYIFQNNLYEKNSKTGFYLLENISFENIKQFISAKEFREQSYLPRRVNYISLINIVKNDIKFLDFGYVIESDFYLNELKELYKIKNKRFCKVNIPEELKQNIVNLASEIAEITNEINNSIKKLNSCVDGLNSNIRNTKFVCIDEINFKEVPSIKIKPIINQINKALKII